MISLKESILGSTRTGYHKGLYEIIDYKKFKRIFLLNYMTLYRDIFDFNKIIKEVKSNTVSKKIFEYFLNDFEKALKKPFTDTYLIAPNGVGMNYLTDAIRGIKKDEHDYIPALISLLLTRKTSRNKDSYAVFNGLYNLDTQNLEDMVDELNRYIKSSIKIVSIVLNKDTKYHFYSIHIKTSESKANFGIEFYY